jgi:hypothetical protein
MNKITVQSNGVSFTVETDATEFSVAGVEFKFSATKSSPSPTTANSRFEPNSEGRRAMFVRTGITNASTIACIRAMRIAMAEELDLRTLRNMAEKSKIFLISPAREAAFEAFCRQANLFPTYV